MPITRGARDRMRNMFGKFLESHLKRPANAAEDFALSINAMQREENLGKARTSREVGKIWDNDAAVWEKTLNPQFLKAEFEKLFEFGEFRKTDNVTVVASGVGIMENFIAKHITTEGRVLCLDISHEMNKQAKNKSEEVGTKNLHTITGELKRMPIKTGTQDKIICTNTVSMDHYELPDMIKEAKRVLKRSRDSRLIIGFTVKHPNFPRIAKEMLESYGFSIVGSKIIEINALGNIIPLMYVSAKPK